MHKARFKTKLSRRQRVKNVIWFLCIVILVMMATIGFYHAIGEGHHYPLNSLETYTAALFMMFFIASLLLFPVVIIAAVLGSQRGRARIIRDNIAFTPISNIDYYRDNLEQIEPFIVSILIDLDLYGAKDIVATLLRMHRNGVIDFAKNGRIKLLQDNQKGLNDSEKEFVRLIRQDQLSDKKALQNWKDNRFREASKRGYIRKKDMTGDEKIHMRNIGIAMVGSLVAIILWGAHLAIGMDLLADAPTANFIISLAWLATTGLVMGVPWYLVFRSLAYHKRDCITWERTDYGNEKAEKIAGLCRFIQDFSQLSNLEKEQVALWDDYLLYAIVLEENEKIVKDISRNHNIKLNRLGNLRKITKDSLQTLIKDF